MMLSLKSEKHNQKRQSQKNRLVMAPAAAECPRPVLGRQRSNTVNHTAALPLRTKQGT